tara:strand:+ start:122 stop:340 length:219 start_codon:yes stop_codon:yes gene_type:complete
VLHNFDVAGMVLMAPFLALLCPFLFFISHAALFTKIEGLSIFLYFLDHRGVPPSLLLPERSGQELYSNEFIL